MIAGTLTRRNRRSVSTILFRSHDPLRRVWGAAVSDASVSPDINPGQGTIPARRVLVCGGRDFTEWVKVWFQLKDLPRDTVIVHGGARGADSLAEKEASGLGLTTEVYEADWENDGRAAGPIRNQRMLDTGIDLVIAFAGGNGTADMVRRARKAGVEVIEVDRA